MTLGRSGSDIAFTCGPHRVAAYRAIPATGRGRGVLVVAEAPGLTEFDRDVCDRLARAGFVALAPELPQAEGAGFDPDAAPHILGGALDELLNCDGTDAAQLGVLGFGAGGVYGALTAACNRRVGAVVACDGAPDDDALAGAELSAIAAPILWILGEMDDALTGGGTGDLEARLAEAGISVRRCIQPGAERGFMNEGCADRFDATATAEAWDRMLAFLGAEL